VKTFETLWLGRLQHWVERLNLSTTSHETIALENFLRSYLEDISKYTENRRTYLSESFHSWVTHYCPKDVPFIVETRKPENILKFFIGMRMWEKERKALRVQTENSVNLY
jgi:hypothetical protein